LKIEFPEKNYQNPIYPKKQLNLQQSIEIHFHFNYHK
jgi:hypothetical protein